MTWVTPCRHDDEEQGHTEYDTQGSSDGAAAGWQRRVTYVSGTYIPDRESSFSLRDRGGVDGT